MILINEHESKIGAHVWFEPDSFEIIYLNHERKLFLYAYSILKSDQEAEDVIQDVFLKILISPDILAGARNTGAYLFRMCRNSCLNILARRKRGEMNAPVEDFAILAAPLPSEDASRNEEVEILNRVIGSLSPGQREALVLKVYESRTLDEIARMTNVPVGTVATRYRSAMNKIRTVLCAKAR